MHDPDRVEYLIQIVGARIAPALRGLRFSVSRMLVVIVIQLVVTSILVAICGVTLWAVFRAQ
jgi:hypothetical protein